MILAICSTWAINKRAISRDDWFYGMCLGLFEAVFEITVLAVFLA